MLTKVVVIKDLNGALWTKGEDKINGAARLLECARTAQ